MGFFRREPPPGTRREALQSTTKEKLEELPDQQSGNKFIATEHSSNPGTTSRNARQRNIPSPELAGASTESAHAKAVPDDVEKLARSMERVLDLGHTNASDITTSIAPAVVHQKIMPHVHEIVEEKIQREIHTHDVYHRIQPIHDIEVRPTRHFVRGTDGGLVEVSENDIVSYKCADERSGTGEKASNVVPPTLTDQQALPDAKKITKTAIPAEDVTNSTALVTDPSTTGRLLGPGQVDKYGRGQRVHIRKEERI